MVCCNNGGDNKMFYISIAGGTHTGSWRWQQLIPNYFAAKTFPLKWLSAQLHMDTVINANMSKPMKLHLEEIQS